MTDTIGPFDGINWTQDAWYRHAPKWAPSGVNGTPAASTTTGDLPITFSGLNFTVGVGRAWVRGAGFERTTPLPAATAIAPNTNASLSRRDRVVLRRDLAAKTVAPTLTLGTASSSPTAPAVQRSDSGQWDLPLFSFLVPPNSGTSISGVVDERAWLDSQSGQLAVYDSNSRAALTAFGDAPPGLTVYEGSSGNSLRWDATNSRWFKVPGIATKLLSLDGILAGSSGTVNPGASNIGAVNAIGPVPAHAPGSLRIEVSGYIQGASLAPYAGQLAIGLGTTSGSPNLGNFGANFRFHNLGEVQIYPFSFGAYVPYSDGTAKWLWLMAWNDGNSSVNYTLGGWTWQVYQL